MKWQKNLVTPINELIAVRDVHKQVFPAGIPQFVDYGDNTLPDEFRRRIRDSFLEKIRVRDLKEAFAMKRSVTGSQIHRRSSSPAGRYHGVESPRRMLELEDVIDNISSSSSTSSSILKEDQKEEKDKKRKRKEEPDITAKFELREEGKKEVKEKEVKEKSTTNDERSRKRVKVTARGNPNPEAWEERTKKSEIGHSRGKD
ncbi:hypothetical protein NF27_GF00020 [Candidatus Jidaibacter acanthamoeba]|uniref:Uncharacterized protein n=1 Tax=Candidatus Jidaibacter acanthamoebae TaxID=86105 RepID=A0A0C1QGL8_9RICK|nr:hypothetical protein [Candidatus Jidaibacter acanthamoeba]KIE04719.1 hypothetical protein NF27_GF00020 [Candidatus Jidaibacter acanthamoeba]